MQVEKNIGLALSGGGVRAMAYHAGVLRWLADVDLLQSVRHVSSVSGGSLFVGLVFHYSGNRWPDPLSYKKSVYPKISSLLTSVSLQKHALRNLLINPMNWRFLLSRANVLSFSIEKLWGIESKLGDLPDAPIWSINGTTAENGRRFRFKRVFKILCQ